MSEIPGATDLLGDPLRPLPDKRGRRKLRYADEVYEKVEVLSAAGMLQEDIAAAIGISAPTLRKYFRPELDMGPARQRARVLGILATQADKGNVTAAKAYLQEIDRHQAAAVRQRGERGSGRPAPAPLPRIGKKVQARAVADAAIAGDDKFAPRGGMRLAAVNGAQVSSDGE
jgi:AraC-like DNA-binding protein